MRLFDRVPTEGGQSEADYSERVVLLGRLKPGTARETRRVVHVFLALSDLPSPAALTPVCGETLAVGDMQWLPRMTGMPCEPCLVRSDGAGSPARRSPSGFGLPPARHDPAAIDDRQRRLLGGMATPPAGSDLSW